MQPPRRKGRGDARNCDNGRSSSAADQAPEQPAITLAIAQQPKNGVLSSSPNLGVKTGSDRAQNIPFGAARASHPGNQVAAQNGGSRASHDSDGDDPA
jgi:hypothetical protein